MKSKRKLLLIFPSLQKKHFFKDIGAILFYLLKTEEFVIEIWGTKKTVDIPKEFNKNLNYKGLSNNTTFFYVLSAYSLLANAPKFDVLFLYHFSFKSIIWSLIYKLRNTKGFCYLKSDCNQRFKDELLKKLQYVILYQIVNLISFSLIKYYKIAKCITEKSSKLIYLPNCLFKSKLKKYDVYNKNNLIVTIGEMGNPIKNHELLLNISPQLLRNRPNWKIIFIGKVLNKFRENYENLIKNNPSIKDQILLMGYIDKREKVFNILSKSSIYVCTSNSESFNFSLLEAAWLKNVIISTKVGVANELTKNGEIGKILKRNNKQNLKKALLCYIDNNDLRERHSKDLMMHSRKRYSCNKTLKKLLQRLE